LIVTGCPGSGKSYFIKDMLKKGEVIDENAAEGDRLFRTAFHYESSFSDFVGCYKPEPLFIASEGKAGDTNKIYDASFSPFPIHLDHRPFSTKGGEDSTDWTPTIFYDYRPGPFLKAYIAAIKNPALAHVLLIEEINRADPAHVFGDLLQLLDRSANGSSEYPIMPNPDVDKYLLKTLGKTYEDMGRRISLPANLYIFGTMNRADETVNHLDTAFLRRWSIKYLRSNGESGHDKNRIGNQAKGETWLDFRTKINAILAKFPYIEGDKYVGPYFLTVHEVADRDKVFSKLIMYLWYDVLAMDRESVFKKLTIDALAEMWESSDDIFTKSAIDPMDKE